MSDWPFRILTGTVADFAADLNALAAANGFPAVLPAGWTGAASAVIDDITRMDFDTFTLPSGLHVNARLTVLPNADPAKAAQVNAFWPAAIAAWFGTVNGFPVCPTLASFTNPQIAAPQIGGQVWQSTGKTALISPPPVNPKRVWA